MPRARDSVMRTMTTALDLSGVTLMWVTPEMTEHVWQRVRSTDDLPSLLEDDAWCPASGLMGLGDGFGVTFFYAHNGEGLTELPLAAIAWGFSDETLGLELFCRPTAEIRKFLRYRAPKWSHAELHPVRNLVIADDLRRDLHAFMFMMWQVAAEQRAAEVRKLSETPDIEGGAPRRIRDRDDVRIISLRRPAPASSANPGSGRPWDYRTVVRRHQRTYWTGPGRTVPVKRMIEEYIAGPEDAPLRNPAERVYALRH